MSARRAEQGFTLLEALVALLVFALVATVSYAVLGPAGEGFRQLADARDAGERSAWLGRRLREDVAALAASMFRPEGRKVSPVRIVNDNRGEMQFDECWLLVRMRGRAGIWQVHYFLDEQRGRLMREMRLLWARDAREPEVWDMGEADSFAVEAMDAGGRWRQDWPPAGAADAWPRALRFRIGAGDARREWIAPVLAGRTW